MIQPRKELEKRGFSMSNTEQIVEVRTESGKINLTEVKRPRKEVKDKKKDSK